jgi:hypothetical protein
MIKRLPFPHPDRLVACFSVGGLLDQSLAAAASPWLAFLPICDRYSEACEVLFTLPTMIEMEGRCNWDAKHSGGPGAKLLHLLWHCCAFIGKAK